MHSFFILERPRTSIYLGKRSHRFTSFQKKGLHYINTPKQLILNFDGCINDNFNVKIDRFVVVFLGSKRNCGYTLFLFLLKNGLWMYPQFLFEQKRGKRCISLSETQVYYIKFRYMVVKITRACFHENATTFSYCPFTMAFYFI